MAAAIETIRNGVLLYIVHEWMLVYVDICEKFNNLHQIPQYFNNTKYNHTLLSHLFFWLHPWQVEVPGLGTEPMPQL